MSRTTARGLPSSLSALTIVHTDDRPVIVITSYYGWEIARRERNRFVYPARAEVSLDSASCKFIAPGNGPPLKEILNDAMTRVDVGVAEHLKKVESLMSSSVHGVASTCRE
jgi:hypothetical protein